MKALRIVACTGPNPGYSKEAARAAAQNNEEYNVPRDVTYKAGTVCDHPDCWIHCVTAVPKMQPLDDACHDKVEAYLNHPSRVNQLKRLRQLSDPEVLQTLPKQMQTYISVLASKWLKAEPSTVADAAENSPIDSGTLTFFEADVVAGGEPDGDGGEPAEVVEE